MGKKEEILAIMSEDVKKGHPSRWDMMRINRLERAVIRMASFFEGVSEQQETKPSGMTVRQFIKSFIEPNTTIRLWEKIPGGHKMIVEGDDKESIYMEHKLVQNPKYLDKKVIGVTDILCLDSEHKEAVNLVIED